MMKLNLQKIQEDILERQGLERIFSFFLILSLIITLGGSPLFSEVIRALLAGAGFVTLLLMFFICKEGRTAEQDKRIRSYAILLGLLTAAAIFNILRLVQ